MLQISTKEGKSRRTWLLLLLWIILGAGLRLTNLDVKPPWTDEFATLVLSLGNSFKSIPLDRVISFQDLLAPLIPNPSATASDVVQLVFTEDHHPPTYFALVHLWMQLFPTDGGLVNLWGARSLPALFGILAIPVVYICSYFTFKSPLIANLTAGMLALSPYGVFISQEARHYTLAMLWITISLSCLAIACQYLSRQQKLPIPLVVAWIIVNNFGMATHYFFSFALIAEALAVGLFLLWQTRQMQPQPRSIKSGLTTARQILLHPSWQRLYVTILGSAVGFVGWFWLLSRSYDSTMTEWIKYQPHDVIQLFAPLFQIIGVLIRTLSVLFLESTQLPIVIVSRILMLIFFVWVIPMLIQGIKQQWQQPQTQIGTIAIASFTVSAIGLYLVIPCVTGMDITRGARYHFVYFPGIMMMMGLALARCWQSVPSLAKWVTGKQAVAIVLLMGMVGGVLVATNHGYHKYYRSDLLASTIQQSAPTPILIATTHNSLVQVGEMMGLAWEMRHQDRSAPTQFLFAHQPQKMCDGNCPTTDILRQTIDRVKNPIDLWLVNFHAPVSLPRTCKEDKLTGRVDGEEYRLFYNSSKEDKRFTRRVDGYEYQLYHCQMTN
jgi:uncharacterized membrane protein